MDEAATRKTIIDKAMEKAGWKVGKTKKHDAQEEFVIPLPNGKKQFVDYTLMLKGKVLAVVEAKRINRGVEEAREQARQYADNVQAYVQPNEPAPFIFYTNGHVLHFWDLEGGSPPRQIKSGKYPTPRDLEYMMWRRENKESMASTDIDETIAGRWYQMAAIRAVTERFEQANQREALLVMATGTGKTRTATALVDVMKKSGWAKRILFLVDRIELREQALGAFKEHLNEPSIYPKPGDNGFPLDRRIYVETYHTMHNVLFQKEEVYISPFYFDLIIMDEAHRSLFNTFGEIIDHFDAYKLGLTATPKHKVNRSSYKLFNCEKNCPTYDYTYPQGVSDGFLNDYKVLNVHTGIQIDGLKGENLTEEERDDLLLEGIDPDDIDFEGKDNERKFSNKDTNRKILLELMDNGIKDESGTTVGKTIVFCTTQNHAKSMKELFDKMYPHYGGRLAEVITSSMERVYGKGGLLDQFKTNDYPRIAFSVDMLDTGIDVRELVNLVFAKPVRSWIKFHQMIGRGTRILDDDISARKSWCKEKEEFLIIDCWKNFEYFKENPKASTNNNPMPLPVRLFNARVKRMEASIVANDNATASKMRDQLKSQIKGLPKNSVRVKEKAGELHKVNDKFWEGLF